MDAARFSRQEERDLEALAPVAWAFPNAWSVARGTWLGQARVRPVRAPGACWLCAGALFSSAPADHSCMDGRRAFISVEKVSNATARNQLHG